MSEQQRVAIVTGAAGGIGRELVLGLLGKGLRVAAVILGLATTMTFVNGVVIPVDGGSLL